MTTNPNVWKNERMSNHTAPRVVHVPLTADQWKALKVEATMSEQTIGEVVARAITQAIPTVGKA